MYMKCMYTLLHFFSLTRLLWCTLFRRNTLDQESTRKLINPHKLQILPLCNSATHFGSAIRLRKALERRFHNSVLAYVLDNQITSSLMKDRKLPLKLMKIGRSIAFKLFRLILKTLTSLDNLISIMHQ